MILMAHLGMRTLQSVFLFTLNNVGFCSNHYFLFDTGLGVPGTAYLGMRTKSSMSLPLKFLAVQEFLVFTERKVGCIKV